jgi:hypothetical protein
MIAAPAPHGGGIYDASVLSAQKSLHFFGENLFSSDDRPLAPTLPPLGAGGHCDAPALPKLEISLRLRTGNTVQSQSGDATAAGACNPPKSVRIIKRISTEPKIAQNKVMLLEIHRHITVSGSPQIGSM